MVLKHVAMVAICLWCVLPAAAGELVFELVKSDDGYRAGINLMKPGITEVRMHTVGTSEWISFEGGEGDFWVQSEWLPTTTDVADEIEGDYELLLISGTQSCLYTYTIAVPNDVPFAPLAIFQPISDPTGRSVDLAWTWTPTIDCTWDDLTGFTIEAELAEFYVFDTSISQIGGTLAKTDMTWHVDFPADGQAQAKVQYITAVNDLVSNFTWQDGQSDFEAFHFAPDGEDNFFQVATAMTRLDFSVQQPNLPGDANGDGGVDIQDFVVLKQNYGSTAAAWSDGDFNADGKVDIQDFVILKQNYGRTDG